MHIRLTSKTYPFESPLSSVHNWSGMHGTNSRKYISCYHLMHKNSLIFISWKMYSEISVHVIVIYNDIKASNQISKME